MIVDVPPDRAPYAPVDLPWVGNSAPKARAGRLGHVAEPDDLVDSGTLTTYGLDGPACEAVPVAAGKAVLFSAHAEHAHLVRNETTAPVTFTLLYFDLEPGQAGRSEAPTPDGCPDLR